MEVGTVQIVSPSVGAWLVSEGYAIPEMRGATRGDPGAARVLGRRASDHANKRR